MFSKVIVSYNVFDYICCQRLNSRKVSQLQELKTCCFVWKFTFAWQ